MAHAEQPTSHNTTTTTTTSSGGAGMGFVVGALVVIVGLLAYFVLVGDPSAGDSVTINVEGAGAALEGAASAIEGAAEEATGN